MVSWIVQNNLIKEDLYDRIYVAAINSGHTAEPVKIIPFTDSVEFGMYPGWKPPHGRVIPYGSTSMIKAWAKSKYDKNGFFFNQDNLRTSKWVTELGRFILNSDAQIMTLAEAIEKPFSGSMFVKPDNDLKDFTGDIIDGAELKKFYENVSAGGFTFGTDIPIVISKPKSMGWEYRLFMIGTEVVASSSYKMKSLMDSTKKVPEQVFEFARQTAEIWHPDDAYVMDVCAVFDEEGTDLNRLYKVIEFNCINASGFYNCSVGDIVGRLSRLVDYR